MITSHIFEKLDKGQFSFTDFFGRRIRRIFPALILVMAFSLAFGWFTLLADEYAQLGKHVASGAAFITNFILVDESGYFDNAAETKPMLHLWSLAVEEQFYIVWPLVLWLAWKRKFNLLTITILVAVVSFYLNLRFVKSHPTETFFWPVGRFWELLSGSVLAWLLLYKSDLLTRFKLWVDKFLVTIIHSKEVDADGTTTSNLLSLFGLVLLAYGVIRINESLSFPSKWALIPVLGTVLIIASGSKALLNRVLLMNPIAVWFGLISYPLYLWHWPILSFLQIVEGEMPHRDARIIAVLLSIILAWVTYKLVESPIRFGCLKHKVNAIFIAVLLFCVGGIGYYINSDKGVIARYSFFSDSKADINRLVKISNAWEFSGYPKPSYLFKDPSTKLFTIGDRAQSKTLLVGDSHSYQYYNSFDFLGERAASFKQFNSISFQHPKFPPKIKDFPNDPLVDTVALSYFWGYWYGSPNVKQELRCCGKGKNRTVGKISNPYKSSEQMDAIDEEIYSYISSLKNMGKRVFIVLDNPFGEELNAQSMIYRDGMSIKVKPNQRLTRELAEKRSSDTRQRLISIAKRLNVEIIDPIASLCSSGVCEAFSEESDLLYKDYDHISLYASRNNVGYIREIIEKRAD